jgi:hypothetical protein
VYEIYPGMRVTLVPDETIIDNMIYNINRSYSGCSNMEWAVSYPGETY